MSLAKKLREITDNYFEDQKRMYQKNFAENFPVLIEKLLELAKKEANKGNGELRIDKRDLGKITGSFGNLTGMDYTLFVEYSGDEIQSKLNEEGFRAQILSDQIFLEW